MGLNQDLWRNSQHWPAAVIPKPHGAGDKTGLSPRSSPFSEPRACGSARLQAAYSRE